MVTKRVRKPTVLVIEDYRDSREMMKLLLESLDYRVLGAADGDEALAIATRNQLDLIVTDLGLPGVDGLAVVRRLRRLNDTLSKIPIIILTAFDRAEYGKAALRAGCSDFLTKPVDVDRLHAMIEKLLREGCDDQEEIPNGVQFRE